jgi:hypothetical protein
MKKKTAIRFKVLMLLLVVVLSYFFFIHWDAFEKLIAKLF